MEQIDISCLVASLIYLTCVVVSDVQERTALDSKGVTQQLYNTYSRCILKEMSFAVRRHR